MYPCGISSTVVVVDEQDDVRCPSAMPELGFTYLVRMVTYWPFESSHLDQSPTNTRITTELYNLDHLILQPQHHSKSNVCGIHQTIDFIKTQRTNPGAGDSVSHSCSMLF